MSQKPDPDVQVQAATDRSPQEVTDPAIANEPADDTPTTADEAQDEAVAP